MYFSVVVSDPTEQVIVVPEDIQVIPGVTGVTPGVPVESEIKALALVPAQSVIRAAVGA